MYSPMWKKDIADAMDGASGKKGRTLLYMILVDKNPVLHPSS